MACKVILINPVTAAIKPGIQFVGDVVDVYDEKTETNKIGYDKLFTIINFPNHEKEELKTLLKTLVPKIRREYPTGKLEYEESPEVWTEIKDLPHFEENLKSLTSIDITQINDPKTTKAICNNIILTKGKSCIEDQIDSLKVEIIAIK